MTTNRKAKAKPGPIELRAFEFPTAHEAIQYSEAGGGTPILLRARHLVVRDADASRLAEARVPFAYLCDHEGQIVTIPVND